MVASYCVVKIVSPIFGWDSWRIIVFTLVLYSLFFLLYAFPYYIGSFFQPLETNVFFHSLFLIVLIEVVFPKVVKRYIK